MDEQLFNSSVNNLMNVMECIEELLVDLDGSKEEVLVKIEQNIKELHTKVNKSSI